MPTKNFGTRRPKNFAEKTCYFLLCIKIFDTPIYLKHRTDAHGNFRQCETKIFRRKFVITPIIHKVFRYLKLSETLKGCPKKFFGTMRSKVFAEKTWYPLIYMKLFDTPTFLKHWTEAHKKLWHCETKNFSTEKCDIPYYAKFFSLPPNYLNHWRDAHKNFRQCETKIFRRKLVIHPIIHKIFRYLKLSGTLKGCPKKFFGIMRSKIFAGKRDTLYYTWNFSIPQVFGNIERMPTKLFVTVRQKAFNWKMWYPLLCIKFPVTPNYLKHWRDAHKIFRHCETTNFRRKDVIHPLMHKIFVTPIYPKHRTDARGNFRHCETKIFCQKNGITPSMHEIFWYHKISETLKGCAQNFSALWDKNLSTENCYTPYYPEVFSIPLIIWNFEGMPPRSFSALWDQKCSPENAIPSIIHETFRYAKLCETLNGCAQTFSALWDNKISTEKIDINYFASKLSLPQTIWNIEGMPTKFFGPLTPKLFAGKTWYPSLNMKLVDTATFPKHWTQAHEKFRHCETKKLQLKEAIFLTTHKFSRYPQNIWIIEGMPTKSFGSLRPKFSAGKTWYPLIYMKRFDTPTFLKHWTDAQKNFRHKETKSFRRKNVLLLLCIKFFDTLIFLKTWRNVHKAFRQCETKIFRRKFVITPIIHKVFRYLKLSETLKGCPNKFFGTMRSKIFAEKTWYPLLYMKLFDTRTYLKHWTAAHKKFRHCETKVFKWKLRYPLLCINFFVTPKISESLKGCPQNFSALWDRNFSQEKRDIL